MPLRSIHYTPPMEQTFCSMVRVECHSPCYPEGPSSARETDERAKYVTRACEYLSDIYTTCIGRAHPYLSLERSRISIIFQSGWRMKRGYQGREGGNSIQGEGTIAHAKETGCVSHCKTSNRCPLSRDSAAKQMTVDSGLNAVVC